MFDRSGELRERFDLAASRLGFELDDAQRPVADRLAELGAELRKRRRRTRGVYVHGPVGRGKSFLVDTFFTEAPVRDKLRVHFHDFFDRLHRNLARHRERNALNGALDELLNGCRLVCFDEFHVHDPGDAGLITLLLRTLHARHVTLVTTSNYRPTDLLPNPLFHHLFLPAIELIEKHQDVISLAGPTDYRTGGRHGRFAEGTWQWPHPGVLPDHAEQTTLHINGRGIRALAIRDGLAWFDFGDLCATATSARDYLAIAEQFSTWVISGVPELDERDPETRQRFANVIDVLCDKDITTHVLAGQSIAETLWHGTDTDRIASRLSLLRSPELAGATAEQIGGHDAHVER